MALIEVFRQPLKRRYSAKLWSSAMFIHWGFIIVALTVALVISFTTKGFFILESYSVEDPLVSLLKTNFFASIGTSNGQFFYSTSDLRNTNYKNNLRTPLMTFSQYDNNSDSIFDRFVITLDFPMNTNEKVFSFQAFIGFNFQLRRLSRIQIQDFVYLDYNGETNAKSMNLAANIVFQQQYPLNYKNYEFLQMPAIDPSNIDAVLTSLYNRSASFMLMNQRVLWSVGRIGTDPFKVTITIDSNPTTLLYRPGFWFATKWAWIQFISIGLFCFYLQQRLKEYLFLNNYIPATITSDLLCHCYSLKKEQ